MFKLVPSVCVGKMVLAQLTKLTEGDVAEMILLPVLNEACRIIAEGISYNASDLDVASVLGMGFPAYRFQFATFDFLLPSLFDLHGSNFV